MSFLRNSPSGLISFRAPIRLAILIGSLSALFRAECAGTLQFNAHAAFSATAKATAFGERPPGSAALKQLRGWIVAQAKPLGCQVTLDAFDAQTPVGAIPMTNVILKFPGTSGKALA